MKYSESAALPHCYKIASNVNKRWNSNAPSIQHAKRGRIWPYVDGIGPPRHSLSASVSRGFYLSGVCVCVCQRKTKDRADGMREKSAHCP